MQTVVCDGHTRRLYHLLTKHSRMLPFHGLTKTGDYFIFEFQNKMLEQNGEGGGNGGGW